jgi:uncharacterized protein YbaR (Trm112 family)
MAVADWVLEILVCPVCKTKVELKEDGSALKCVQCRRVYPVLPEIGPVMVAEEATIEDEESPTTRT